MSEKWGNAFRGLSSGLDTIISHQAQRELEATRSMREQNMERLRQRGRVDYLERSADLQTTSQTNQNIFTTGRDTQQQENALEQITLRDTNQVSRGKTAQGYAMKQIQARGTEARSTAYLTARGGNQKDEDKILTSFTVALNKFEENNRKDDMTQLPPGEMKAARARLVDQYSLQAKDPNTVRLISLAAGEGPEVASARMLAMKAAQGGPAGPTPAASPEPVPETLYPTDAAVMQPIAPLPGDDLFPTSPMPGGAGGGRPPPQINPTVTSRSGMMTYMGARVPRDDSNMEALMKFLRTQPSTGPFRMGSRGGNLYEPLPTPQVYSDVAPAG